jgi:hypothetical protein
MRRKFIQGVLNKIRSAGSSSSMMFARERKDHAPKTFGLLSDVVKIAKSSGKWKIKPREKAGSTDLLAQVTTFP